MESRIEILPSKKLIGKRLRMSLANNTTFELWSGFMPLRKQIKNVLSSNLYSMQVYDNAFYFSNFNPATEFEKWAALEVSGFQEIPEEMETYTLAGGLYVVFLYKGSSADFQKPFDFIFKSWLPQSDYLLDHREHFELLGEKYKNNDPDSEEEIWIPIKKK